jgi:cobalamin synthase
MAALAGIPGIALAAVAGLTMLLVGRVAVAKVGGITGDSCGAVGTLVEALVLAGGTAAWA